MPAKLSVIIPTYNRQGVLCRTLQAYCDQSAASEILELLVVDDGSTDGTEAAVKKLEAGSPIPIRWLSQSHRGLAAARNHGMTYVRGELVLFADDDIIPSRQLVAEHLAWHTRYLDPAVGVLGFVPWSPEVRPTPFMDWLALDGVQFGFGRLTRESAVGLDCFYCCNTSFKVSFLRQHGGFDEDFKSYGFEDTEFGYRMMQKGMRLLYNPDAVGFHYKYMTFADAIRRAEQVVMAKRLFDGKEAGKYLLAYEAQQRAAEVPRSVLRRAIDPVSGRIISSVLRPFKLLLDTQIPLPWRFYRRFYSEAVAKLNQSQPM